MIKKTVGIIVLLSLLVLISGCPLRDNIDRYEKYLTVCLEKTPQKQEYCQCYASCFACSSDCNNRCKEYLEYNPNPTLKEYIIE